MEQWESLSEEVFTRWFADDNLHALRTAREALNYAEDAFGTEHRTVVLSLRNLGFIHGALGELDIAYDNLKQSILMGVKVLGVKDPIVADCIHFLADIFRMDGRHQLADVAQQHPVRLALLFAYGHGDLPTINRALRADSNNSDISVVHIAVLHSREDILTELIQDGANINARTETGDSPLHLDQLFRGVRDFHYESVESNGETHIQEAEATITQMLLDAGAEPNAQNSSGQTPLHLAARRMHEDRIRQLLAFGADPTITDNKDRTPADYFIEQWNRPGLLEVSERPENYQTAMDFSFHRLLALIEGRDPDAAGDAVLQGIDPITGESTNPAETRTLVRKVQMTVNDSRNGAIAFINGQQYREGDAIRYQRTEWIVSLIDHRNRLVTLEEVVAD